MARKALFTRLPQIWRRLDSEEGILERFLGVVDSEFDHIHDKIGELFDLRTVDRIPDNYLPFLSSLVGHPWRTDMSRVWNRRKIKGAIARHSYKGTYTRLNDTLDELEITGASVVDMASKLFTWGTQGSWGGDDCYWESADYYHDGAFAIILPAQEVDFTALRTAIREIKPGGERWFFVLYVEGEDPDMEWYYTRLSQLSVDVVLMGTYLTVASLIDVDRLDITVGVGTPVTKLPVIADLQDSVALMLTGA